MYLQITTRCNMRCAHCCYSCTKKGEDMSLEIFKAALKFDDMTTLGGGEPTIHPLFWQFMGLALANSDYVWLATNGKETETALALAQLAQKGVIGCDLSQDEYHEAIDPVVVKAFTKQNRPGEYVNNYHDNDHRAFRDVTASPQGIIKAGRAKKLSYASDGCPCSDVLVKPNGDIYACGCKESPKIGNVLNPNFEFPDDFEHGECWKNQSIFNNKES